MEELVEDLLKIIDDVKKEHELNEQEIRKEEKKPIIVLII